MANTAELESYQEYRRPKKQNQNRFSGIGSSNSHSKASLRNTPPTGSEISPPVFLILPLFDKEALEDLTL